MSILRRLSRDALAAVGLLLAVSVVLFAAVEVLPGDAATRILGQNATPERVEELRTRLGLDRSAAVRYLDWIGGVVRGDLGQAATSERSVWQVVSTPLRNTAVLAAVAFAAIAVVAVVGGLVAGQRPGSRTDRVLSAGALGFVAVPEFVIAGLLISVFAFRLGWFSSVSLVPLGGSPLSSPEILVLPVATATLVGGMFGLRLVRAVVAEASTRPYVEAARLAGLSQWTVLRRHLLPSVVAPTAQSLALLVPFLVAGTVVIEQVFAYPGAGSVLVERIGARDVTVVEGLGLIMAAVVIGAFFVADTIGAVHDGRIRRPTS